MVQSHDFEKTGWLKQENKFQSLEQVLSMISMGHFEELTNNLENTIFTQLYMLEQLQYITMY